MTGEPAQELGVQPGWVLFSVGGELAPPDVNQITKLVTKVRTGGRRVVGMPEGIEGSARTSRYHPELPSLTPRPSHKTLAGVHE